MDYGSFEYAPQATHSRYIEKNERIGSRCTINHSFAMIAFEYPCVLICCFVGETADLVTRAHRPARLPVEGIDMNDR
ncbi:hypothetical protein D3C80_1905010 [compost metagenome]